jgi:Lrp/AsnC family transcriptional regulator, leucine-responsive regulatory protein
MFPNGQLDEIDFKILELLQQNARLDITQIAVRVHRSFTPVQERIRRLKADGYIRRYTAVLDRRLIGRPTLMITLVKLNRHQGQALQDFPAYMYSLPEVQVCLHLSGEYDFLLQVSLKDPQEYKVFLEQRLCILPMVEKVHSSLVLDECKVDAVLPLG